MSGNIIDQMQLVAARNQSNKGELRLGIVSSVDIDNGAMKVVIMPEEYETDWIPFATPGYGFYAVPEPGEQWVLDHQEGSKDNPVALGAIYWNQALPPAGMSAGERILKHKSGSFIKLKADGSIEINAASIVLHNGTTLAEALTKFNELKTYIDNHVHAGVQSGGGTSGTPTVPMPASIATTNVTAS